MPLPCKPLPCKPLPCKPLPCSGPAARTTRLRRLLPATAFGPPPPDRQRYLWPASLRNGRICGHPRRSSQLYGMGIAPDVSGGQDWHH